MPALKTFLVEDNPVILHSLITTLQELAPVEVVGIAEDEQKAVLWLSEPANEAQLVIVDIFLSSGSGLGVLQAAQRMQQGRHLVVLSNYATKDIRARCQALGAEQVFDKSTEIDALIQYCNELLPQGRDAAPAGVRN